MKKVILGICVLILFVMIHCNHTSSAGGVPYMGGDGSNWTYDIDDGSKATLTVVERWKQINDRNYKIVEEDAPLWSRLIEEVFDSNTLFVGKNPFLITEERGSHIAGYGWEANVFLEKEMTEQVEKLGMVFQMNQIPATQWVILMKLEVGNSWTVLNLNYKLAFKEGDAERRVFAEIFASVVSIENITTELGEFETLLIQYTYREEELMTPLCSMYLADIGPVRIIIGDITADLVGYEILPHLPPSNPINVEMGGKLSTTWANIKTQ